MQLLVLCLHILASTCLCNVNEGVMLCSSGACKGLPSGDCRRCKHAGCVHPEEEEERSGVTKAP